MTSTKTTTKQTAANNEFLSRIKVLMNGKIYASALKTMNQKGEAAVVEYLSQFFNVPIDAKTFGDELLRREKTNTTT